MNLSHYSKQVLFAPFFTLFRVTSWPTYSSMFCEVTLKIMKKFIKNQLFRIVG